MVNNSEKMLSIAEKGVSPKRDANVKLIQSDLANLQFTLKFNLDLYRSPNTFFICGKMQRADGLLFNAERTLHVINNKDQEEGS